MIENIVDQMTKPQEQDCGDQSFEARYGIGKALILKVPSSFSSAIKNAKATAHFTAANSEVNLISGEVFQ